MFVECFFSSSLPLKCAKTESYSHQQTTKPQQIQITAHVSFVISKITHCFVPLFLRLCVYCCFCGYFFFQLCSAGFFIVICLLFYRCQRLSKIFTIFSFHSLVIAVSYSDFFFNTLDIVRQFFSGKRMNLIAVMEFRTHTCICL